MADVAPLVENYKTQFASTGQKIADFGQNLPAKIDEWKNQAMNVQPAVSGAVQSQIDSLKTQVTDMTPVGKEPAFYASVCDAYIGAGLALVAGTLGHVVGSSLAPFLFDMFFTGFYAFFCAAVLVPWATVHQLSKVDMSKDDRFMLIVGATFLSAALLGFTLSLRYPSVKPPPMFLFPLAIGFGAGFLGPSLGGQDRYVLLSGLIGPAVGANFVFGLVTGSLGGTFFLWALLLAGVAFVELQVKFGRMWEGSGGLASDQMRTVWVFLVAGFFITWFFSSESPPEESSNE